LLTGGIFLRSLCLFGGTREAQKHHAVEEEADPYQQSYQPEGLEGVADGHEKDDPQGQGENTVEQGDPPVGRRAQFEGQGEVGEGIHEEIGREDDPQRDDSRQRVEEDQSTGNGEEQGLEPAEPVLFVELPGLHRHQKAAEEQQPSEEESGGDGHKPGEEDPHQSQDDEDHPVDLGVFAELLQQLRILSELFEIEHNFSLVSVCRHVDQRVRSMIRAAFSMSS